MKRIFLILLAVVGVAFTITAQENETMYVMKNGVITHEIAVSDIDSIVFYRAVDYNDDGVIINGVKWATRNVDAPGTFAAKPEDAGMFYQWNRNVGWSATNPLKNSNGGSVWNSSVSSGTTWEKANDPSPAGWRVPILAEIQKLLDTDNVSRVWTNENGKPGYRFTDKDSEKSIFMPAAGYRANGTLFYIDWNGRYWSSAQNGTNGAYALNVSSDDIKWSDYNRSYGFSVRSVEDINEKILTVSSFSFNFPASGAQKTFSVLSNVNWTVSCNASWLTISPSSGTNNGTITVTAEENTASSMRTATITIKGTDVEEQTISVKQVIEEDGVEINGVRWATCNVDAPGTFASKPETPGMFYQWNRKIGWSAADPMINSDGGTTWDISFPGGTTWTKANDPSPAGWRVPTVEEIQALLDTDKVSNVWTTQNGVKGKKFTDKISGNTIFLPAAGLRSDRSGTLPNGTPFDVGALFDVGAYGNYWSRTGSTTPTSAYFMYFDNGRAGKSDSYRISALSVRSVIDINDKFVTVSPSSLNFPASGEQQTFTVSSNVDWTVSCDASWITISPSSGTNKGTITVTAEGNTAFSQRTATITVKGTNVTAKIITVTQAASTGSNDEVGVEINGVIWATCNVDAPGTFAAKPEDAGMFYQWNRNVGWSATNPLINSDGGSTWDDTWPTGITWEKANDPSPAGWRVPILAEIQKLLDTDKVSSVWTSENGKNGYRFTDKDSKKSIFMPAVGYRINGLYHDSGGGIYWSSAQNGSNCAYALGYSGGGGAYWYDYSRDRGLSVRAVVDNNEKILIISLSSLNFLAFSEQHMFSIASNVNWTVDCDASWITISPSSGSNDGTITVTAEENTASSIRTATITIKGTDVAEQTISVTQSNDDVGVEINGVIWATCNVDAPGTFAARPEDTGMFYQWNRNVGWSATDPMINSNDGTTWDSSETYSTVWEKANDPSPAGWHVPTLAEIQKLLDSDKVTRVWTPENGKDGYRFTDIESGKSIFLPIVGHRYYSNGVLKYVNSDGYYWSSTAYSTHSTLSPYGLYFGSNYAEWDYGGPCSFGHCVRSVAD